MSRPARWLLVFLVIHSLVAFGQEERSLHFELDGVNILASCQPKNDSLTIIRWSITSTSAAPILLSLSKTSTINSSSQAIITTSYSDISDPLMLPKLGMPFKILSKEDTVHFEDEVNANDVDEVLLSFDLLKLEDYPYKKVRQWSKQHYWFARVDSSVDDDIAYLKLKDYFLLSEEKVRTVYHRMVFE